MLKVCENRQQQGRAPMSCQEAVYQWTGVVRGQFPHLSVAQARVLALWSLGMVLARSCGLTAVSTFLALGLGRQEGAVRQQLREFCYEASAKRGAQRQALVVEGCFVPLLRWVLRGWQSPQLALALDATTLGDRFVVLVISVVYRGCAIPVAWRVLPAGVKQSWRDPWLALLDTLQLAIPPTLTVIVLADRGLYARWLFRQICRLGWHPFLRINRGAKFRPAGTDAFRWLLSLVPTPGCAWQGRGTAFASRPCRLECTLLARWEAGYADPWLILTDLPAETSDACWYGVRAWIEQGFKITKRAGWQWQRTRMTDPERAARLWLAVAVATLWLLSVGAAADEAIPDSTLLDVTTSLGAPRRQRRATRLRLVSVFRRGWVTVLVALLNDAPLPLGSFPPDRWPASTDRPPLTLAPSPPEAV